MLNEAILSLHGWGQDDNANEVMKENANKSPTLATMRDLIAGEVSKTILKTKLPTKVQEGIKEGWLWVHDTDYSAIKGEFNCCLPNFKDMLENGTVVNGVKILSPKSFTVACTVLTQLIANLASHQYGGLSVNAIDQLLAPYVRKSYDRNYSRLLETLKDNNFLTETQKEETAHQQAELLTKNEIKDGIQTINYQLNSYTTTNGQTPFITLFMYTPEDFPLREEALQIQEEILTQRLQGMPDNNGNFVTPAFPKLIYTLTSRNHEPGTPDWELTKLAIECSSKRMYPDYISEKKMIEQYGSVFGPMGCRSFLSGFNTTLNDYRLPDNMKPREDFYEGRFNKGVQTINLPWVGLKYAKHDLPQEDKIKLFLSDLSNKLEVLREAGEWRTSEQLFNVKSDVSPVHWQYGGIARLKPGEVINDFLFDGYSSISLGYVGLYEAVLAVTGESHTSNVGRRLADRIFDLFEDKKNSWNSEGVKSLKGTKYEGRSPGWSVYGTPAESLCYRFAKNNTETYGSDYLPGVTDRNWITNSYHVYVGEEIDAFSKLEKESHFQERSTGGSISYVELPNMSKNLVALESLIKYMYDTLFYSEINLRADKCFDCGFEGEINYASDKEKWVCPSCGNEDYSTMSTVRRICGYLGSIQNQTGFNKGKSEEMECRVLHM